MLQWVQKCSSALFARWMCDINPKCGWPGRHFTTFPCLCCQIFLRGGGLNCNSFPILLSCRTFFLSFFSQIHFLEISERAPNKRNSPHASSHPSALSRCCGWMAVGSHSSAAAAAAPAVCCWSFYFSFHLDGALWGWRAQSNIYGGRRMETSNSTCLLPAHAQAHSAVGKRQSLAAVWNFLKLYWAKIYYISHRCVCLGVQSLYNKISLVFLLMKQLFYIYI